MVFILKNKPIAFVKELSLLAITDLHLGIEFELRKKGINVSLQSEKFLKILEEAKKETNAKRIVVLGDVKHKVPAASAKEIEYVRNFFENLSKVFEEIFVCKGNHDDMIEEILQDYKVYGARGFKIKDYGFFHGHAWPFSKLWNCRTWIIGHLQAAIEIRKGNFKKIEKVVIKTRPKIEKGKLQEIIILPAFSDLAGNLLLNKGYPTDFLFEKVIDVADSGVYLLDGSYLGELSSLNVNLI
jgi:putative SbcD/Mre11-related phosphoesterase